PPVHTACLIHIYGYETTEQALPPILATELSIYKAGNRLHFLWGPFHRLAPWAVEYVAPPPSPSQATRPTQGPFHRLAPWAVEYVAPPPSPSQATRPTQVSSVCEFIRKAV
ncbi:unnamed protein product, partial [Ilex paraguariensis]